MRYVIVGNGITGVTAACTLREADDEAEIVIVSGESDFFYSRTALMWSYMRQMTRRNLEPYERWFWRERKLTLLRDRVTAVDTANHRLTLERGGECGYDKLLLAVGGRANMFGWPGQDLDGVCNMCTLQDLDRLEAVRPRLERAVIVGGGLIGIELVEMMLHDRVPVTYLLREPWYWDLVLTQQEAEIVHQRLGQHGVDLVLKDEIGEIVDGGDGRVAAVKTKNGRDLPCQLVGIAVGVGAETTLARESGIECGRGILVDEAFCTSAPDVYAAGDCAEVQRGGGAPNLGQKLWYTGLRQAGHAARSMLGDPVTYDPGVPYNSAQFLFLDYLNVGWLNKAPFPPPPHLSEGRPPEGGGLGLSEFYHRVDGAPDSIRIAYWPESRRVMGFSMLGSRWDSERLIAWIEQRRTLDWVLEHLDRAVYNEEFRNNRFAGVTHA
jgi:NAD(P)H-nitrite reductase large subunit